MNNKSRALYYYTPLLTKNSFNFHSIVPLQNLPPNVKNQKLPAGRTNNPRNKNKNIHIHRPSLLVSAIQRTKLSLLSAPTALLSQRAIIPDRTLGITVTLARQYYTVEKRETTHSRVVAFFCETLVENTHTCSASTREHEGKRRDLNIHTPLAPAPARASMCTSAQVLTICKLCFALHSLPRQYRTFRDNVVARVHSSRALARVAFCMAIRIQRGYALFSKIRNFASSAHVLCCRLLSRFFDASSCAARARY